MGSTFSVHNSSDREISICIGNSKLFMAIGGFALLPALPALAIAGAVMAGTELEDRAKHGSVILAPGEKHTYSGTLSLVKCVTVICDNTVLCDDRCWTGPTKDSNNYYYVYDGAIHNKPRE